MKNLIVRQMNRILALKKLDRSICFSLANWNSVASPSPNVTVVPDTTTPGQSDPLDPLSSLMSGGSSSQRYQEYVSPRSLSTDSSTTESPVHEEQGFGQNYGNYFPTPGVLPSILYSQLYGNQFQNPESAEQRAVADSCSVRQEEVRPDNNVWRPYWETEASDFLSNSSTIDKLGDFWKARGK